jgi:hypothetical protein
VVRRIACGGRRRKTHAMPMPTCPSCGGAEASILAPGYFECTTVNLANVVPAGAQGNLTDVPIYVKCGHRYQGGPVMAGVPQCWCGMYAVGACKECREPLCGQHFLIRSEVVYCSKDAANLDQAAADAMQAAADAKACEDAARHAGYQVKAEAWEAEILRAFVAITDPIERYVRAVKEVGKNPPTKLKVLIGHRPSDGQFAEWLINRWRIPPKMVQIEEQSLFGSKRVHQPGWSFSGDSTAPGAISVLQDGRVHYGRSFHQGGSETFGAKAISQLFDYAGLRPLDLPPRPKLT